MQVYLFFGYKYEPFMNKTLKQVVVEVILLNSKIWGEGCWCKTECAVLYKSVPHAFLTESKKWVILKTNKSVTNSHTKSNSLFFFKPRMLFLLDLNPQRNKHYDRCRVAKTISRLLQQLPLWGEKNFLKVHQTPPPPTTTTHNWSFFFRPFLCLISYPIFHFFTLIFHLNYFWKGLPQFCGVLHRHAAFFKKTAFSLVET